MTTKELSAACGFAPAVEAETREIAGIFTGDLLSWAMGRAKEGDAWFTVMGNVNAVAVAALAAASFYAMARRWTRWRKRGRKNRESIFSPQICPSLRPALRWPGQ